MDQFGGLDFSINPGDIFSGFISHIVDKERFYVIKCESSLVLSDLEEYIASKNVMKMFWFPVLNEKFLIQLNGEYFRAKRMNSVPIDSKEFINAFLIDIGETIQVRANNDAIKDFYVIPDEFVDVPALAKRCKLASTENNDVLSTKDIKKSLLTFETVETKGDVAILKIWPRSQVQDDFDYDSFAENLRMSDESDENNALYPIEEMNDLESPKINEAIKELPEVKDWNFLDEKEAVDEHGAVDYDSILIDNYYDIKIEQFITLTKFIFRFDDPNYVQKLSTIQEIINEHNIYKTLASAPKINDFVFVKISGEFFRAKIIDKKENFIAWLLDFGSLKSVKHEMIYEWSKRFDDCRFLSDEIEISDIKPVDPENRRAMFRIMDLHDKYGKLVALITQTTPTLKFKLFDGDINIDIGDLLIAEGFAVRNKA